jgi:hypothetical protein
MGSFKWRVDGEVINIIFSLIRNARWLDPRNQGNKNTIVFDYLDYEDVFVGVTDLDIEENEYDRELWSMLLQATNLEAT